MMMMEMETVMMEQMEEALDSAECIHRLVCNGDDGDDDDDNKQFYGDYVLPQWLKLQLKLKHCTCTSSGDDNDEFGDDD